MARRKRRQQSRLKQFPQRVLRVLAAVNKKGQVLVREHRRNRNGDSEEVFHFEPSGHHCPPASAREAIASGLLHPRGDGLFGFDTSQSWGKKRNA
jgi:hypothetical protein